MSTVPNGMRAPIPHTKLSDCAVLDIVRGYHVRRETQKSLAAKHGVSESTVNGIVHGRKRGWAYDQVAAELQSSGAA